MGASVRRRVDDRPEAENGGFDQGGKAAEIDFDLATALVLESR
jgi:hypothetical protein